MMTLRCQHLMVAIIYLKVGRGFPVVMRAVEVHVMPLENIFFNMRDSVM